MDARKKTAAIGKRFARRLQGRPAHYTKDELKARWNAYLPEQKPAWTIRKDTEVVVAGLDADVALLEEARARGLEVISALTWLGLDAAADATSIGQYLRQLVNEGHRFDTGCNEGDGTSEVWTVPLRRFASAPALGPADRERLASFATSEPALDVLNTLVHEASVRWKDVGAESFGPSLDAWYAPTLTSPPLYRAPGVWGHGQRDLMALRAETPEGRVIPGETLEERCRLLGAEVYTLGATRVQSHPSPDAQQIVLAFGGLEKGGAEVSFALVRIIHT
ncbi:MAG: hypothetical protein U0353_13205 [Sandaracinus sp.]